MIDNSNNSNNSSTPKYSVAVMTIIIKGGLEGG